MASSFETHRFRDAPQDEGLPAFFAAMPTSDPISPGEILAFWREAGPDRWYKRDGAFDDEVRRRYLAL